MRSTIVPRLPGDALDSVDHHMNAYIEGMGEPGMDGGQTGEGSIESRMTSRSERRRPNTLRPGARIEDRYELIELLGSGGMGSVWKARDQRLSRVVAFKLASLGTERDRRRFLSEARLCSNISHRNVVKIFDVGTIAQDQTPYYTMEFVEGRDLATVIAQAPPSIWAATLLLRQIASALSCVHAAGVIHRDIKPGNVVINESPSQSSNVALCKLVDFGLAKSSAVFGDGSQTDSFSYSVSGHLIGTPLYMSPEQIRGESADHKSDIYSFGCLAYEVLTGTPPFAFDGLHGLLRDHLQATPTPMFPGGVVRGRRTKAAKGASPQMLENLETLVTRCLAKGRDERPASMQEIKRALTSVR